MKSFIIILTVLLIVTVIFNQVTYYVIGDTDSPKRSISEAFKKAVTTGIVLTYILIPISWLVEICCSVEDMMDVAQPLTWTLVVVGAIMFFGGIGSRSDENPYIPGTFLGAINIFVIVLTLI